VQDKKQGEKKEWEMDSIDGKLSQHSNFQQLPAAFDTDWNMQPPKR
jgi:hypothetical protein